MPPPPQVPHGLWMQTTDLHKVLEIVAKFYRNQSNRLKSKCNSDKVVLRSLDIEKHWVATDGLPLLLSIPH